MRRLWAPRERALAASVPREEDDSGSRLEVRALPRAWTLSPALHTAEGSMIARVILDVLVCTAVTVGLVVVIVAGHFALRRRAR
jgi:hypothetical protein